MRKIPSSVEEKALSLWLQGNAYRSITHKLRISLGVLTRIVNDKKKSVPDLDELRKLNVLLTKSGSSIYDAVRGGHLLGRLNELGIGLDGLEGFTNLVDKLSSEHQVEAEKFVEASLRLRKLEVETGRTYSEVVKDVEEKQRVAEELNRKVENLKGEISGLELEKKRLKEDLNKSRKECSLAVEQLKRALYTRERLEKLGLEKVDRLAKFIEGYELLGFDAQEVQKLTEWRKSLAEAGIDSDGLEGFIKRRGPLEKQLRLLNDELSQGKARLKILATMERETQDIKRIRNLMDMKKAFACGHCGSQFFHELRRFEVSQCLATGQPIIVNCQRCGVPNTYNPHEVLARLGFEVLS